jgi:hypothetical protein
MMTTDTAQAVTGIKDFQVDQRYDANQKFYYGTGAGAFSWYIGLNGPTTLGFFNSASMVRGYFVDSGYSPAGGSGATFVGPTILAASLSTTSPGMVVEGAIGGMVDIFNVASAGLGAKYLSVGHTGNTLVTPPENVVGLAIYGYDSGNTADLLDVYSSSGTPRAFYIDSAGVVHASGIQTVGLSSTANVIIYESQSDSPSLQVQGYPGGSANILEVYNQPGGTDVFYVGHNGASTNFKMVSSSDSTSYLGAQTTTGYAAFGVDSGASAYRVNLIANSGAAQAYVGVTQAGVNYTGVTGTVVGTFTCGGVAKTTLNYIGGVFVGCS